MDISNQIHIHIFEHIARTGADPEYLYLGRSEERAFIEAARAHLPEDVETVNGATYHKMQVVTVERSSFLEVGGKTTL